MFVPRTLRLKGVKESQKRKLDEPQNSSTAAVSGEDALVQAMEKTNTELAAASPASQAEEIHKAVAAKKGSRFTTAPITPECLAELVAGMELLFSDYAHEDGERKEWLEERYRVVEGEEKYIHLTAILSHPNISTLKPQPTQPLLQKALHEIPSETLEQSITGFHVRRRPSTYPRSFIPANSFELFDNDGLSFWDQRTIYVEPHIRHMCATPAKVAYWLKEHGQLKAKWLPIQSVQALYNGCAFVVLSGNVMHEDAWRKWRASERPENWRVMTKVENLRRTEEYEALVKKSWAEVKVKRGSEKSIAKDGGNAPRSSLDLQAGDDGEQSARKVKRNRSTTSTVAGNNNGGDSTAVGEEDVKVGDEKTKVDADRASKRRA